MSVQFFDLLRQNEILHDKIFASVNQVVNSGRYILGENVSALEKEVAAFCGSGQAVGVASGTDALHLALRACGIQAGDEVITTPFTFVATAEAIAYCGAIPIFVDIEPNTFNISASKIEPRITNRTKALLPVHLFGLSCEMEQLTSLAKNHHLKIVEDCAQSIGAKYNDKQTGSFGDAGSFSFFPTKNLGCFGDGGMVVSNDPKVADEIKVLRGHGSRKTYHYDLIGYNSRLDEIQAAVLRVKLPHLNSWAEARRKNAGIYKSNLAGISAIQLPVEPANCYHVYNQFTIRVKKDRDRLFDFLKKRGVGAMVYYPLSLHLQTAFADLNYKKGDFPESEAAQGEVLSLPIFPELKESEVLEVCSAVREFYKQ